MRGGRIFGVSPLTAETIDEVVRIHIARLGHTLNSRLGPEHLKYLYQRMAMTALAYVGVASVDGRPVGVVSGTTDSQAVTSELFRCAPRNLLVRTGLRMLAGPHLIRLWWMARRVAAPILIGGEEVRAVLTAIAVDSKQEGMGVGRALVQSFEAFLRQAGVETYRLDTEVHNERALVFYRAMGFSEAAWRAESVVLVRHLK